MAEHGLHVGDIGPCLSALVVAVGNRVEDLVAAGGFTFRAMMKSTGVSPGVEGPLGSSGPEPQ